MSNENGKDGTLGGTPDEPLSDDAWKKHLRHLILDIEHCVVGLIAKGSRVIFKTVWMVLSQTVHVLRNLYYEEVLKDKLYTAFEVDTVHPIRCMNPR